MTGFYLTLIAVLVAGIGARDQVTLARLTAAQGARPAALAIAIVLAAATAAAAAWAAQAIAPGMPGPARAVMSAMALVLAGGESLLIVPGRKPAEPTRSLGALALVLVAQQLTDAPRFLIFAVGVGTGGPVAAGAAGALGGAALMVLAWTVPELVTHRRAAMARRVLGAVLLLTGLGIGLHTLGLL